MQTLRKKAGGDTSAYFQPGKLSPLVVNLKIQIYALSDGDKTGTLNVSCLVFCGYLHYSIVAITH